MTAPLEVCRFCGLMADGHVVRRIGDASGFGGYEMKLVGADGHVFELQQFPRAPKSVATTYRPFSDDRKPKNEGDVDMTVLQRVQSLDMNRVTPDDMIDLITSARAVKATYVEKSLPVPEALSDGIRRLDAEIEVHRKDSLEKRLKEIRSQKTTLESVSEKRARLEQEEASITAALGVAPVPVGSVG